MTKILVLHGPNLNLLGQRQTELYGSTSLSEINQQLQQRASELGIELSCFQSNSETELLEVIQKAGNQDYLIINPAAFTHTSIALRDAVLAVGLPFIEVHLSNIYAREEFRRQSYFTDIAMGCILGLGPAGYIFALEAIHQKIHRESTAHGHPKN